MTENTSWRTPFQIDASAYSVVGKVREQNEDASCIEPALGLFAVADGLGGHRAGEHASGLAVAVLLGEVQSAHDDGAAPQLDILLQAFDRANLGILAAASADSTRNGMGTTLTAVLIVHRQLLLAHVGDSRAWRIRDGVIEKLTHDHTVVEEQVRAGLLSAGEASCHPLRHILSRCLGIREGIEVDLVEVDVAVDDVYVLASDGLVPGVSDEEILAVVQQNREAKVAAQIMVDQACDRDGKDNITAVVVGCREE